MCRKLRPETLPLRRPRARNISSNSRISPATRRARPRYLRRGGAPHPSRVKDRRCEPYAVPCQPHGSRMAFYELESGREPGRICLSTRIPHGAMGTTPSETCRNAPTGAKFLCFQPGTRSTGNCPISGECCYLAAASPMLSLVRRNPNAVAMERSREKQREQCGNKGL